MEIYDFYDNSFILRRTRLFQLASSLIESATYSKEDSKIVKDNLCDLLQRIKLRDIIVSCGSINDGNNTKEQVYSEQPAVREKGCGKRLKGGKEKA
ncbi:hypothetical protein Ddye_026654 [Dipteronia dyeriana]|uniref:Uncharacterized protein n=1 Tax=Dipteronia dyeriana TaxID=168575 RepID=A0AAD9TMJ9_9ROSI|nr:hypothetical protein Ddye_026654 [Dipteronia dyeriana]